MNDDNFCNSFDIRSGFIITGIYDIFLLIIMTLDTLLFLTIPKV